ncbi:MAG: hypothetical protein P4M06_16740 [Pandoraea sp.]|nr:hypothetical protein [Pandoraea sp.]MDR3399194.1 hypothetical protein [Pandoraea sp.]
MAASELFFPVGSLGLSKEQSAKIKTAFGHEVDSVPLYRVVPVSSGDRFVPLADVPGLPGILVHYGDANQGDAAALTGANIIASVISEMKRGADDSAVFAAHTKLMAPHPDESAAAKARPPVAGKAK